MSHVSCDKERSHERIDTQASHAAAAMLHAHEVQLPKQHFFLKVGL